MCADAFSKFLPFCTGFAAGCMIWMVVAEVLPDAFKVTYIMGLGSSWLLRRRLSFCSRFYSIFDSIELQISVAT